MVVTKSDPFTTSEIENLKEALGMYIKTVIDIDKKICSAGMARHYEGEAILLEQDSVQSNIWGGGVDLETKVIDFDSIINIRPRDGNTSNEIQDPRIREKYTELTKHFFREVF